MYYSMVIPFLLQKVNRLTILCGKVGGWTQYKREGKVNNRRKKKGSTKEKTRKDKERTGIEWY